MMAGNTRLAMDGCTGGLAAAIALPALFLAGCQPTEMPRPQTGSEPQIEGPAPPSPVGAGSFPRSFLIPGTDTSIRIGG